MSDDNGQAPEFDGQAGPAPVVEFGRYRLFQCETGLVLARAVDTCERCQGCGCGEKAEAMMLPDPRRGRAHLISWLATNANRGLMATVAKAMSSNGD